MHSRLYVYLRLTCREKVFIDCPSRVLPTRKEWPNKKCRLFLQLYLDTFLFDDLFVCCL